MKDMQTVADGQVGDGLLFERLCLLIFASCEESTGEVTNQAPSSRFRLTCRFWPATTKSLVPGLDPISGDTLPLVIQPPYQFPAAGLDAMPDSSAFGGQTCAKPSGDVIHLKLLDGDDPPGLPKGHDLKVRLFVDRNLLPPSVFQHLLCLACIAFIISQTIVTGALLDGYRSLYLSYPFIYPFAFSFQLDFRWCSYWL
jgi:hypothetical protein